MIEVLFGESEAAAMKIAKNFQNTTSIISGEFREEKNHEFHITEGGKPISGNSKQVICIPFMLDIGDNSYPIDSEYRKNLILNFYTMNTKNKPEVLKELEGCWSIYLNEIERLKHYAAQGQAIRLWYSDAPYSLNGFYYICKLLQEYPCKIFEVKLPPYRKLSDNEMQFHISWGEIEPGEFYHYLSLERELSHNEIRSFATDWNELMEEKGMLRAVVNGRLTTVTEEFYDFIIRKEIPDGEVSIGRLIGKILGKYRIGVSDWWYAKRILLMIEQGELVVVKHKKELYGDVVKKIG